MSGFHIEHVMLKYLINRKRGGRGPLGPLLKFALAIACFVCIWHSIFFPAVQYNMLYYVL